jgi:uncharacterized repeat protein (TIGR03847 family)
MARRIFSFDRPDRFVCGALGSPGHRTFFLQASRGPQVVSVALEKTQVAVLAERLGHLLLALRERGLAVIDKPLVEADTGPLVEPVVEQFRVGTLTLAWDADRQRVVIEARELGEFDEEDAGESEDETEGEAGDEGALGGLGGLGGLTGVNAEAGAGLPEPALAFVARDLADGPDVVRVQLEAAQAHAFAARAIAVVQAGRPPCPLCGAPLDPGGHFCPRRNGFTH